MFNIHVLIDININILIDMVVVQNLILLPKNLRKALFELSNSKIIIQISFEQFNILIISYI